MDPITVDDVFTLIRKLLAFPYPTICRHLVMCDLISLIETKGYPGQDLAGLTEAVVHSDDETALRCLDDLTARP